MVAWWTVGALEAEGTIGLGSGSRIAAVVVVGSARGVGSGPKHPDSGIRVALSPIITANATRISDSDPNFAPTSRNRRFEAAIRLPDPNARRALSP